MVRLGDVCIIERGGSPRPIQNYITSSNDGINWIKIGDTQLDSMYITRTKEKIISDGLKKSRFVHKGDFLLTNSMSFGRPYILDIDGCIHDGWLLIRDEQNKFDKKFLYYYLSSSCTYQRFQNMAVGGVVNNLNSEMVRNLVVPLPPLAEQKRIADVLDKASGLIKKRKEQIRLIDQLAKSLFVEMFGDPVENPMGWEIKTVAKVCNKIVGGGTPSKSHPEYYIGNIPWVTPKDMKTLIIKDSIDHINQNAVENSSTTLVPPESVLMVIRSGILKHTLPIAMNSREIALNQDMKAFTTNKLVTPWYLLYFFKAIEPRLLSHVRAVTADNIEYAIIKNYKIPLPPLSLQQEFADRIDAIEKQKALFETGLEKLEMNYRALMQEYFG